MTRLSDHVHHLGVESELVSKVLHHVLHRGVAPDATGGPHVMYVLLSLSVRIADVLPRFSLTPAAPSAW